MVAMNNLIALLSKHKVIIPPIQRDYAQGRTNDKVTRIRERFLDNITDVLSLDSKILKLDFIYGNVYKDKYKNNEEIITIFNPLDGQQRLTTLFLIHWYVAVTEKRSEKKIMGILENFSYATRTKSRDFCSQLIAYKPKINNIPIVEQITNEPWFFLSWFNDPTITSMLVVLKTIENKFKAKKLNNTWEKLTGNTPRIQFYLLEMADIGLPDDLYIKMNSRGKELTDFEFFKSQFSKILPEKRQKEFNNKIDSEWSELFWNIFKDKNSTDLAREVDDGFLNFFWYITDFIIVSKKLSVNNDFWIKTIENVYKKEINVDYLFKCLDLFTELDKKDADYFNKIFYIKNSDYKQGKTRLFFNNPSINLFHKCAETYKHDEDKKNPFSIGEQLMLHAFIVHKLNNTDGFNLIIRQLRNLIASSEDQLRKEYFSSLYQDVESLVKNKILNDKSKFSSKQIAEEKEKSKFCSKYLKFEDILFKLEDHDLLRGNLSLFEINDKIKPYIEAFHKVFNSECDYYKINIAMLTIGDYTSKYKRRSYGKSTLKRFGNKLKSTWIELFTPSTNRHGFDNTQKILKKYLQQFIDNNNNITNDKLISKNLGTKKDWKYYYIKYESFCFWNKKPTDGFYYWNDFKNNPYECYMMLRTNFGGRHWIPYLREISQNSEKCTLGDYGEDIQLTINNVIFMISMKNNAFVFTAQENDAKSSLALETLQNANILSINNRLEIEQNNDGIDVLDRIEFCLETINKIEQEI